MPAGTQARTQAPYAYLQRDELALDLDLLGEKVGSDRGLVLRAVALVDVAVHERGLADTARATTQEARASTGVS